jgi:hypothetical protein
VKHVFITRVTTNCHTADFESISGMQCRVPTMTTLDLQVQLRPPAGCDMQRLMAVLESRMDQAVEDCMPYSDGGEIP